MTNAIRHSQEPQYHYVWGTMELDQIVIDYEDYLIPIIIKDLGEKGKEMKFHHDMDDFYEKYIKSHPMKEFLGDRYDQFLKDFKTVNDKDFESQEIFERLVPSISTDLTVMLRSYYYNLKE